MEIPLGTTELPDGKAMEILMSICMQSARQPAGLTKDEIVSILSAYECASLYDICEVAEFAEEPDTDTQTPVPVETPTPTTGSSDEEP